VPKIKKFDLSLLKKKVRVKRRLAEKKERLEVKMIPGPDSDPSKLGFTWEPVKITDGKGKS
jgi:hypothetical protein